jgi:dUTPase
MTYKVTRGDAIAQLVFNRVSNVKFGKDQVILRKKIRGDGGFGSTG